MCRRIDDGGRKFKLRVTGPTGSQHYSVFDDLRAYPLCYGDGSYRFEVFREAKLPNYQPVLTMTLDVNMPNPLSPYLYANTYCHFLEESSCVRVARDVCKNAKTDLEIVGLLARWIMDNLEYDMAFAKRTKEEKDMSWYLPSPDVVMVKQKGICWEYASLFAAMCRTMSVPCKIQVGWARYAYHAWNEIITKTAGTLETGGFIVLADRWLRLDLTYMDAGRLSNSVLEFVKECENYRVDYSG